MNELSIRLRVIEVAINAFIGIMFLALIIRGQITMVTRKRLYCIGLMGILYASSLSLSESLSLSLSLHYKYYGNTMSSSLHTKGAIA